MKRIEKFLNQILDISVILCVLVMVVVVFLQVIFRFILNDPLSWSEELARFLFVAITFLGAAICARENLHIGMDFVTNKLSERINGVLLKIKYLLMIIVSLAISVASIDVVKLNLNQKSPALRMNMGVIYSVITIGFIYIAVYYAKTLLSVIRLKKEEGKVKCS